MWAGLLVAATLALGHQAATRLQVDNSLNSYLDTDDDVRVRLERFHEQFGRAEVFLVLAEGDVYTAEYLTHLRALEAAINADPAPLDEVTSLLTARHVRASSALVRVEQVGDMLDEPPTAAQITDLRKRAGASPALVGHLLEPHGRASAVLVRMPVGDDRASHALYRRLLDLAARSEAPGFHIHVAGAPALAAAINARMLTDAYRSLAIALVLMGLLLALLFRHPLAVLGPLLVAMLSIVWTFGAMAALGYPMTGLHNIVPTFLLTVGLGDSVHLLTVFRGEVLHREPGEAAHSSIRATGLPIVLTTLTTAAGMLGFTATRLGVTTEFGAFAALGVGFAMLHSLVLLPILLSTPWAKGLRRPERDRPMVDRVVLSMMHLALVHPTRVLVGALVVAATAGVGMASLRVSHNPVRFLPEGHPVRAAFAAADQHLGGTVNLEVEIDSGVAGGLKSPQLVEAWAALEAHLRRHEHVGGTASLLDVLRETWGALNADRADAPPLPDSRPALAQTLLAFEMGDPSQLSRFMTADARYGRMSARVPWLDAAEYRPLAEWLSKGAAQTFGEQARIRPTGGVYTLLTIVDSLVEDMLRSFGLALALVGILLVLLLRSVRLGLLAMVPNVLPIAVTLGVMGFADIPLDMFNLLLASVAIGVVVDDTVHFFHHVAVRRRAGDAMDEAVRHSGRQAGRAMVATSAVLCIGFGAFVTASMVNLVQFGLLLVVTVISALLAELLVGPALLRLLGR